MKREIKTIITAEEIGQTLDVWLADRFTYRELDAWRQEIAEGRILLNNESVCHDARLTAGDEVTYLPTAVAEPAVNSNYEVLYEDEWILAVNKPPNLPCHPGGCFFNNTLWALLRKAYPDARLVNRLDRETSGIVLLGKGKEAASNLGKQFEQRSVAKEYLVLVEGDFPDELIAQGVLDSDPESPVQKKRRFRYEGEGESCETTFKRRDCLDGFSLIEVRLGTGRMHQIRATLCSLGYPVVGDKIYGVDDTIFIRFISHKMTDLDHRRLRLPNQALYAWRLTFQHPHTDEMMVVEAPAPAFL